MTINSVIIILKLQLPTTKKKHSLRVINQSKHDSFK